MISREEALHIARLARLRLSDEEIDPIRSELSTILEHIDRIGAIDLEGVDPTTHVVELDNALRPDVPHKSLDREVALSQAPDPVEGSFRAPSPQAENGE